MSSPPLFSWLAPDIVFEDTAEIFFDKLGSNFYCRSPLSILSEPEERRDKWYLRWESSCFIIFSLTRACDNLWWISNFSVQSSSELISRLSFALSQKLSQISKIIFSFTLFISSSLKIDCQTFVSSREAFCKATKSQCENLSKLCKKSIKLRKLWMISIAKDCTQLFKSMEIGGWSMEHGGSNFIFSFIIMKGLPLIGYPKPAMGSLPLTR